MQSSRVAIACALLLSTVSSMGRALAVENHAKPEILCELSALKPGATAWIAVRLTISDGWHLYWDGRNDSGLPPKLDLTVPPGYSLGDWIWPAPQRHIAPGDVLDHIFESSVLAMAPLRVPADAKIGAKVELTLKADWLACDQRMCVPEEDSATTTLTVADAVRPGRESKAFEAARHLHAKAWPASDDQFSIHVSSSTVTFHVAGATKLEFYPRTDCVRLSDLLTQGAVKGDKLALEIRPRESSDRVSGVLAVARNGALSEYYRIDTPVRQPDRTGTAKESIEPSTKKPGAQ